MTFQISNSPAKALQKMDPQDYLHFLVSGKYDPTDRSPEMFSSDWQKLSDERKRLLKEIEKYKEMLGGTRTPGNI